jgi:hypothetical protein
MLEEVTWGVTPSVTSGDSSTIPFENESLTQGQALESNPHISGSREMTAPVKGRSEAGGDMAFRLNPFMHNLLWKAALGDPVDAGVGPYTHTYTVSATLPSYSMEVGWTDISEYWLATGMTLGNLRCTVRDSGFVEMSATFAGKGGTMSATSFDSAPSTDSDNPFDLTDANIALTEGGSPLATATEVEFEINNNLDLENYVIANEGQRGAVPYGRCGISGTLNAFFSDSTLYDKAVAGTESAIVITLKRGDGLGSAGNESCVITIPEIRYEVQTPAVESEAGILVSLPFMAYYDDATEGSAIEVVVSNDVASY